MNNLNNKSVKDSNLIFVCFDEDYEIINKHLTPIFKRIWKDYYPLIIKTSILNGVTVRAIKNDSKSVFGFHEAGADLFADYECYTSIEVCRTVIDNVVSSVCFNLNKKIIPYLVCFAYTQHNHNELEKLYKEFNKQYKTNIYEEDFFNFFKNNCNVAIEKIEESKKEERADFKIYNKSNPKLCNLVEVTNRWLPEKYSAFNGILIDKDGHQQGSYMDLLTTIPHYGQNRPNLLMGRRVTRVLGYRDVSDTIDKKISQIKSTIDYFRNLDIEVNKAFLLLYSYFPIYKENSIFEEKNEHLGQFIKLAEKKVKEGRKLSCTEKALLVNVRKLCIKLNKVEYEKRVKMVVFFSVNLLTKKEQKLIIKIEAKEEKWSIQSMNYRDFLNEICTL